jgi:hypothetical protein
MSTNFPTSVDAFTNPTSGDTLDNPPHDQQHADINDAMEAVQTSLLDGAPLHIDDANERVGIGTTSPSQTLQLGETSGGLEPAIDLVSNGGRTIRMKAADSGNFLTVGSATAHSFALQTNNVRRLTVDSSGNVGINDTTPSYTLDVNGDINATSDVLVGGSSLPRGFAGQDGNQVSLALTTTATLRLSTSVTTVAGRRYLCGFSGFTYATSTSMLAIAYMRFEGTSIQNCQVSISSSMDNGNLSMSRIVTAGSTGTTTLELYGQTSTGTSYIRASTGSVRPVLYCIDLG